MLRPGSVCVVVVLSAFAGTVCSAEPILFMHQGTGSGTIDGRPFADADFVIRANADTSSRRLIPGIGFTTSHDTTIITIDGVGTYEFVTPTRTFVNRLNGLVGFARLDDLQYDLFLSATDDSLKTWDMLGDTGPVSGTGRLLQWDRNPSIFTDGGILVLDSASTDATFTAVIPAPGTLGIAASCGLVALSRRRR